MSRTVYPLKCQIRADSGITRVDVYDDIGGDGFFGGISAQDFVGQMAGVKGALEVHINSGGGDVFDGIAIGNALRKHRGKVTTVVDGVAASIASVIAQAGKDRVMAPGSMMMIHDAWGMCVGNADDMAKMQATLDKNSDNIAAVYAQRAGGTAADWRATMKAEAWYTADEAVAAGLADRVDGDSAALPAGLDLAAFESLPGRIAAALRKMPVVVAADGNHAPMTGTHTHMHPAYGSQGGDQMHSHEHSHDGDASHGHGHGDGSQDQGPRFRAATMHGDHEQFDPDGDGDCDACAAGDTDHDYWSASGEQLKPVPGHPMSNAMNPGCGCCPDCTADGMHAIDYTAIVALIRREVGIYGADKYKQADRDRMAKSGEAMPDGSYPIADEEDLDNAIRAVGRGGADHDTIRKHIIKRAKALGLSERIPDNWNADGSLQDGPASNHATTDVSGPTPEQIRAALRGATE